MSKFEKYANKKLKIIVNGEQLEVEFLVRDRLELATIHECKNQTDQYARLITFCTNILKRSYPEEDPTQLEGFLAINLEAFIEEVMVATNLATREMFRKQRGDFRPEKQETDDKGGVPSDADAAKK